MPRYKLTLEYDGTPFVGWQRQENGLSVQEVLEAAAASFSGAAATVFGAGRTDAGVHARGQVAHVDIGKAHENDTVRDALNYYLKAHPVSVLAATAVDEAFHARFSATERVYVYRIVARRSPLALDRQRAWHVPVALDAAAMHRAAQQLVGRHDFTSFRAAQCQAKSPVKTLDQLTVEAVGEDITVTARARSFLHSQVRTMVGSLKLVGEGRWSGNDLAGALAAKDRAAAGPNAPPHGLYLQAVCYDAADSAK
jgi:tRNA pseudouridine38-40 synthase